MLAIQDEDYVSTIDQKEVRPGNNVAFWQSTEENLS